MEWNNFRVTSWVVVALILAATVGCKERKMFVLSADELASFQIVVPVQGSAAEKRAAEVLQQYLERVTGFELAVVGDDQPKKEREILLGDNARLRELGIEIDFPALKADGFAIKTVDGRLVIAGGSEKGTLYGVYAFLEEYLGCRKYSPEVEVVPALERIELAAIDTTQVPVIEFREAYYRLAGDPGYAEWHKLDSHREDWGLWVHTFAPLLSPEEYFEEHPEYFSLVKGKRVPNGQLCLTNEEVFAIVVAGLREQMAEKPEAHYWSVSQNDTFSNCQCDACRAIDEREGSPSGTMLTFVNRVAAEFPDKTISTLAYQYTRAAPKTVRPAENVNIVLCSIECNRSLPIADDPSSASFRKDTEDWAKICDNILVWDYVIQFANLVSPFPNLRVLQPNIRYFVENHSVAMFQQGNREIGGEFAELRTYLIAKLLWNPEADVEALMDDFLQGYYGEARVHIRLYIDRMHDALEASGQHLNIFGNPNGPVEGYLSPALIKEYNGLFDKAEAAVKDRPELLQRVEAGRLPLHYAMLEQAKQRGTGEGGMFVRGAEGQWEVPAGIRERLELFTRLCNRQGVTRVTEWHTTPDEYQEGYLKLLERPPLEHLARGKKVALNPPFDSKYPADGEETLTDGLRGALDHSYAWLGFEGVDMEGVVDLEEVTSVHRVSADFLQASGSWIFQPERVRFAVSEDGREFVDVGGAESRVDERKGGIFVESFTAEFEAVEARFVRVRVESRKSCPNWHIGAGSPCWIFVDELIVE